MWIRERGRERNKVKDSFDNLATGLCYFNERGVPVLVNHKMNQIFFDLTGHDLQYEEELAKAVAALDHGFFYAPNGRVWKFDCKKQEGFGAEYIAADVTDIHYENCLLQEKNKQLKEVNAAIEEIGRNYAAIAREEEILSMKMRIHSEMGKCGLSIRKYYQDGCPQENKEALALQIKRALSMLKGEVRKTDQEESMVELKKTAEAIGARIELDGQMPLEEETRNLLVLAIRECLVNVIRHAGGDTVYVQIERDDAEYAVRITNNGCPPEAPIVEGGGLTSLRAKIERAGGRMKVEDIPQFCLCVNLPGKGGPVR